MSICIKYLFIQCENTIREREAALLFFLEVVYGYLYSEPRKMASSVILADREIAKNETPQFDDSNSGRYLMKFSSCYILWFCNSSRVDTEVDNESH